MSIHPRTTDIQICLLILQSWKHIKSIIEDFAASHDLTLQQIFVLYNLYSEDHILMGTLAGRLHCDASNVTGIIERLQSAHLVTRRELPQDRRAKQLVITPAGRSLIDELIPRLPAALRLASLNASQKSDLRNLLQQLVRG